MTKNCTANIRFKMSTDCADDEELIAFAESLSESRGWGTLDSRDLGDSMGVFIRAAIEDFYNGDLDSIWVGNGFWTGNGFWVRVDMEFDLFNWE